MAEFEEVNVLRKDAPDVVFEGKLIVEADSRAEAQANTRKSGDRWTELAVYELRSGDWVAIAVACSDKAGESDFGDARTLYAYSDEQKLEAYEKKLNARDDDHRMQLLAMDFWGWTWLAKKLADKAGWDVRERLE